MSYVINAVIVYSNRGWYKNEAHAGLPANEDRFNIVIKLQCKTVITILQVCIKYSTHDE